MIGRPQSTEVAPYYSTYIDRVKGDDPFRAIESQLEESFAFFSGISEEKSLHRYAPDKWSIREVLNHISDTERVFAYRAFWFARGFETPLPSFDQTVAAKGVEPDEIHWAAHMEEFRWVRLSTMALFEHMPAEAWSRSGVASDNRVSVRALAYIIAGHAAHHIALIGERYL